MTMWLLYISWLWLQTFAEHFLKSTALWNTVKPWLKVDFDDTPKSTLYQGSILYHIEKY